MEIFIKKIYNRANNPKETRNRWAEPVGKLLKVTQRNPEPVGQGGEKMIDQSREIALKVLYEVDKNDAYSNIALAQALNKARNNKEKIEARDVGFISEIVYGTISWKLTLDEIIKKHSNIKVKKISPWILNILRMSIYQIIFLDRVPKSAAVNEGVNLAKRYGHKASSNFVNAILRKIEMKDYEEFFEIQEPVERISKTTSMPVWIVEELLKDNSVEKVYQICKDSNIRPKLCVRVNSLKTNQQELIQQLEKENIKIEKGSIENFLLLDGVKNIEVQKEFKEGFFTVQDEAAGLVPTILEPQPNEKVLDACSSPGGKTTYIAELMRNQGFVKAWDIHEHRVKLVDQAAKRLGISIIETEVKDATKFEQKYVEFFDKILLDVPCLGIGVLKRKPDIKWKRKREDIEEIAKIQKNILENCSKYLKKGGELVYSTCSILAQENEEVVQNFIKNNNNFEIKDKIQLYQDEKTDGFFICKMRKNQ